MNRRRVLAILAAVVLALLGTFIILAYVSAADRRAQEGEQVVGVLQADSNIPVGTPASDLVDTASTVDIAAALLPEDAVGDVADLGDQVTTVRILAGQPLVERQFGAADDAAQGEQDAEVPQGREIVAVVLDAERAVGGRIAEDDTVGVVVSIDAADTDDPDAEPQPQTAMVLKEVRVVRVADGATPAATQGEEGDAAAAGTAADGPVTVWLEVSSQEAETIVFGQVNGTVWLTAQPNGSQPLDRKLRNRDNIFTDIQPGSSSAGSDEAASESGDG